MGASNPTPLEQFDDWLRTSDSTLTRIGPFIVRENGSLVLNVRLTMYPNKHAAIIRQILAAPRGAYAGVFLNLLLNGARETVALDTATAAEAEPEMDLSGLGMEL